MLNQTFMFENEVAASGQTIQKIEAYTLKNIPIQPPPFRDLPKVEGALLLRVETNDGVVGWATSGYTHPSAIDLITKYIAPKITGEDPFRTERLPTLFDRHTNERPLGRAFQAAMAMIDIACWDIKGKTLGKPVHILLGGARDRVPVYVTHGAAYDGAPVYSAEELAAEAAHLVSLGNTHVKNTVGRQQIPDPKDDYKRMAAMRDAIGPDIQLSMDGNLRMTVAQAAELCDRCFDLDIAFIEEPIHYNDPANLRYLRERIRTPIAAAENEKFTALQLLQAGAVDYIQPNINNDGGLSAGVRIATLARVFNVPLSHGNGNGPHNIALHAGVQNGGLVEYHFHKWMTYNALFQDVPQPENGWLTVSQEPGFGLEPKDGVIAEYRVTA